MRIAICLLLACVIVLAGCDDDEEATTPVAGSTAEEPEQSPGGPDGSDRPASAGDEGRDEFENGGDGEHEPEGGRADAGPALDEGAAIETIERYFTEPADRETCALLSERFLRRSFGGIDGCVLGGARLASSVEVAPGETGAKAATGYEVDAADSVYSGEKITVDLVAGPDGWLIDSLEVDAPVGP